MHKIRDIPKGSRVYITHNPAADIFVASFYCFAMYESIALTVPRAYFIWRGELISCSIIDTKYYIGRMPPNHPVPAVRGRAAIRSRID